MGRLGFLMAAWLLAPRGPGAQGLGRCGRAQEDLRQGCLRRLPGPRQPASARARGCPRTPSKAASLFKKACEGQLPQACLEQGRLLRVGESAAKELPKAMLLLERACTGRRGRRAARISPSSTTAGRTPPKDLGRAAEFFQKACDANLAPSCSSLGVMYAEGGGSRRTRPRPPRSSRRPATAARPRAAAGWPILTAAGDGVAKDPAEGGVAGRARLRAGRAAGLLRPGPGPRDRPGSAEGPAQGGRALWQGVRGRRGAQLPSPGPHDPRRGRGDEGRAEGASSCSRRPATGRTAAAASSSAPPTTWRAASRAICRWRRRAIATPAPTRSLAAA